MSKDTIKQKIILYMESSPKKSFSMEEIAEGLQLQKSGDFKFLVQTIASMEQDGSVIFTKKGKIKLAQAPLVVEGTFRRNERGFGFVTIDPEEDDVYIPKESTQYAMDGDIVAIDIIKPANQLTGMGAEGKVVEIRQRALQQAVGEFVAYNDDEIAESDLYGVVIPKDKKMQGFKIYIAAEGIRPVDGSIVQVAISHYPEKGYATSLEGFVKQVIGHKNDPGMDILGIVVAKGIPTKFSEEALAQADSVPDQLTEADIVGRRDLRKQTIVTIDGADAKDLDDAVTVEQLGNGNYFLGVHIADVSYYVTEDSPLDGEAFERGTSVYLTDRVIPMLPQRLSNGICSLNPKVPRFTLSCEMEIDLQGNVVSYDIFPSVIQTTARMTYTAVNQILEDADPEVMTEYQALVPMFQNMATLHKILEEKRLRRGALAFEEHEARVLVDEKGHPEDIILRTRGIGERLIESFMLAANETVAEHFAKKELPFIYRVHEQPKEEKMQRFFDFAAALGILVRGTKGDITPKDLQKVIEDIADKPESLVINTMLLRSMQQARYAEENFGHYGLGATYYTHFTSPIRRYPDLIVHRLIRTYHEDTSKATQGKWQQLLPDIAQHSSKMERRAVEAEREVDALKKAEFMADKIDEEFDGIISSVTKFGIFVELPNTVEGLIHINELKQDYFHFVENHLALVGERTRQVFKIGQKVRIKVVKADPETREIDFELVSAETLAEIDLPKTARRQKAKSSKEKAGRGKSQGKKAKFVHPNEKSFSKKGKQSKKNQPFYKKATKKKKKK
ncbi:ribonuclease R [Enterococcus sp. PF1-24]|uniref:ribonuclease R n=1 Tax=unclassified Enterococcus TaxID=2608891 RepID=UPI002476DBDA|nr:MULTISPECIES: ribonuclease R [unclassified Enterococcus]MDH6364617.1 ribonuclease R [Enterococcus sp. PFB1-1]MDH6401718.1 ribonuclease R [Enterococcus sp. PF1-24]